MNTMYDLLFVAALCLPGDRFARSVIGLGDLDKDGFGDYAVSDRTHEGNGRAWLLSGADGRVMRVIDGRRKGTLLLEPLPGSSGETMLVVVSMSATAGIPDVVEVYDGLGGVPVRVVSPYSSGQRAYKIVDDVDRDGVRELVVALPQEGGGRLVLLSGATGEVKASRDAVGHEDRMGASLALYQDLDGDGARDLLVGAPGAASNGRVFALSTKNFNTIAEWKDDSVNGFGTDLIALGDLDVDGMNDVLVVDAKRRPRVYSGKFGTLLYSIDGPGSPLHAQSMASVGDCNADGISDIGVGCTDSTLMGEVFVLSGKDGEVIHAIDGAKSPCIQEGGHFGVAVSGGIDVNKDGCADVVIGSGHPLENAYPGTVLIYSGKTGALLSSYTKRDMRP